MMVQLRQARQWTANLGLRLLLRGSSPLQSLVDHESQTHRAINQCSVEWVEKAGETSMAALLYAHLGNLNQGSRWADEGWRNTTHFWDPCTGSGLWGLDDALVTCRHFYAAAVEKWQRGNRSAALFALGAASHLIQDLCVPHHTRGTIFCGHQSYERWVEEHVDRFLPRTGILEPQPIELLATQNAELAYPRLDLVDNQATADSYQWATEILLPQAVRSTAALLVQFLEQVERPALVQLCVG